MKMNFNILLVKKIENIITMTSNFDKLIVSILDNTASEKNNDNVYNLTSLYMLIRAEHGGIVMLNDKFKNQINEEDTTLNDDVINKLYDLSTFVSIIENINNLVSNMDFEYKKIVLMFPKLVNKKPLEIILISNTLDKSNKYIEIFEEVKKSHMEHKYHVIECMKEGNTIKCDKIIGKKMSLNIKSLPALYIINNNTITELPINTINSVDDLINLLK